MFTCSLVMFAMGAPLGQPLLPATPSFADWALFWSIVVFVATAFALMYCWLIRHGEEESIKFWHCFYSDVVRRRGEVAQKPPHLESNQKTWRICSRFMNILLWCVVPEVPCLIGLKMVAQLDVPRIQCATAAVTTLAITFSLKCWHDVVRRREPPEE